MKRLLIITMAILAFTGCKSKTVTTETDTVLEVNDSSSTYSGTHEKDSTYAEKNRKDSVYVVKVPATNNQVTIENPCDPITNELRKFEVRAGKTTVTSDGNSIDVKTECEETVEMYSSMTDELLQFSSKQVERIDSIKKFYQSDLYINSVQKEVKKPFWLWFPYWMGVASLGLLIVVWFLFKK